MFIDEAVLTLISLCPFTAGPTDRAVQKLAYGRHRNEWGTNIFLIKHINTFALLPYTKFPVTYV